MSVVLIHKPTNTATEFNISHTKKEQKTSYTSEKEPPRNIFKKGANNKVGNEHHFYCACISTEAYNLIMKKINALSPKKQKKWKDCAFDSQGVKTRLRFHDGQLQQYSVKWKMFIPIIHEGQREEVGLTQESQNQQSRFATFCDGVKSAHPNISERELFKLYQIYRKQADLPRAHTNPRNHGEGKHGEISYNWRKD